MKDAPSPQEVRRSLKQLFLVAKRWFYNFIVSPWRHCAQQYFFTLTYIGKKTSVNQYNFLKTKSTTQ